MAAVALIAPATAFGGEPQLDARSWLLVDAADGEVLSAHAAGREAPVASATKLMTAYVARRRLGLGKTVVAPPYTPNTAESLVGLEDGERIEVRDLLMGLLLASGNDAAVALADAASGSVPRFVRAMNRAAGRLDLRRTSYANPIGLDEPGNHSTAADLVELTLELREDPFFRRTFDLPEVTLESGVRPRRVVNRNTLVRDQPFVNGVKTGYTLGAGYVLVGSATERGVTLVSAVLGAPSEAARDAETLELLRYGFSLYRREQPVKRNERLATATVRYQDGSLPLVADRALSITVRRGEEIDVRASAPEEVEGPTARGERLGEAVVAVAGERVGRVPLVAARAIPAADLGDRVDAAIPGGRLLAWVVITAGIAALLILVLRVFGRLRRGG